MAHPDNEIDSEFADRISDLEEITHKLETIKNDNEKFKKFIRDWYSSNDHPNNLHKRAKILLMC